MTPVLPPPLPEIDLRRKPLLARKTTWAAVGVALLVGTGVLGRIASDAISDSSVGTDHRRRSF